MANQSKVQCTSEGCVEWFSNVKEMKRHKKHSSDHNYCHVCDIDFESWDSMILHKAQMSGMDPFRKTQKQYAKEKEDGSFWNIKEKLKLETGPQYEKYGELKFHMYHCKFCGYASNTESARQKHTQKFHPFDQKVKCPGCDQFFPRAAGMVYHLEEGHCSRITSIEFKGYLQHKGLVLRLLENPLLLNDINEKDIHGYYESARDDATTGGVSLIDVADDNITWDDEELIEPERPAMSASMPAAQRNWPTLTPHKRNALPSGFAEALGKLGMGKGPATSAWGVDNASKTLFPKAQPTPAPSEWQKRQQELHKEDRKTNIMVSQFWNPASKDYDPDRFYDPIIEKHRCPFPTCDHYYDISADCQRHIFIDHSITQIRCPCCLKLFEKYHALIAHMETSDKCQIKRTQSYGKALDEFSGGFLSTEVIAHPDLKAEDGYTVGMHKYESTVPPGWEERVESTTIGTKV